MTSLAASVSLTLLFPISFRILCNQNHVTIPTNLGNNMEQHTFHKIISTATANRRIWNKAQQPTQIIFHGTAVREVQEVHSYIHFSIWKEFIPHLKMQSQCKFINMNEVTHTVNSHKCYLLLDVFSYKLCAGNEQQKQCGWNIKFSACY